MIAKGKGVNDTMVAENAYDRSCDTIQYDLYTQQFRKTYKNCKTCTPISKIAMHTEKIGLLEYIKELILSYRLSRI